MKMIQLYREGASLDDLIPVDESVVDVLTRGKGGVIWRVKSVAPHFRDRVPVGVNLPGEGIRGFGDTETRQFYGIFVDVKTVYYPEESFLQSVLERDGRDPKYFVGKEVTPEDFLRAFQDGGYRFIDATSTAHLPIQPGKGYATIARVDLLLREVKRNG